MYIYTHLAAASHLGSAILHHIPTAVQGEAPPSPPQGWTFVTWSSGHSARSWPALCRASSWSSMSQELLGVKCVNSHR